MTPRCLAVLAFLATIFGSAIPAAAAETRLALAIGISDYGSGLNLANATKDAKRVGEALAALNFQVDPPVLDPDKATLQRAVQGFSDHVKAEAAKGGEVTVFVYLSSHGIQLDDPDRRTPAQFIIPTHTTLFNGSAKDIYDFQTEAVDATLLLNRLLHLGATRVIVVFDACRTPPANLGRKDAPPLALRAMAVDGGASPYMVIYATEEGRPAYDDLDGRNQFSDALVEQLPKAPNVMAMFFAIQDAVMGKTHAVQRPTSMGALNYQLATSPTTPGTAMVAEAKAEVSPASALLGSVERGDVDGIEVARAFVASKGFDALKLAAQGGDHAAEYLLGLAYIEGIGTPKDPEASADWLVRALKGEDRAANALGYMYYYAELGPKDPRTAIRWWTYGVDHKVPGAMNNMGVLYRDGVTLDGGKVLIAKSPTMAADYFGRAAKLGYRQAIRNLANMYRSASLGPPAPAKAMRLYDQAIAAGDGEAAYQMAFMYDLGEGADDDPAHANALFAKAAELGYGPAANTLANRLDSGKGADKDPAAATRMLKRGAELGNLEAMVGYAARLGEGIGGPRSTGEAVGWYKRAIDAGSVDAKVGLARLYLSEKTSLRDRATGLQLLASVVREESDTPQPNVWPPVYYDAGRLLAKAALSAKLNKVEGFEIAELTRRYGDSLENGLTRFTIPMACLPDGATGSTTPIDIYVFDWGRETDMATAQFDWLERERGCRVPADVRRGFTKLFEIARENKVSYRDLTIYALGSKDQIAATAPAAAPPAKSESAGNDPGPSSKPATAYTAGSKPGSAPAALDPALLNEKVVLLLQGKSSTGVPSYAYLELTLAKVLQLREVMRAGKEWSPADFGTVLASGEGEPDRDLRARMAKEHNMVDTPKAAAK